MENKTFLMFLAILTVGLALANIGISFVKMQQMTGYAATAIGQINITVNTNVDINMTRRNATWGQGMLNDSSPGNQDNATLQTSGEVNSVWRGNWSTTGAGKSFILANVGNVNCSIRISSDKNMSDMCGVTPDTHREFWINITNKDAGACRNDSSTYNHTRWDTVNKSSPGTKYCSQLGFLGTQNEIYIDHSLTVPADCDTTNSEIITTLTVTAGTAG